MVSYNEDSSDSEKISYNKKNELSPVNRQKSEDVSTAHGIVFTGKSPTKKSPTKKSEKEENSDSSEDPSKKQVRQKYGIENSSDDEQIIRSNTNVKVQRFLSDDENEDEIHKFSAATHAQKNIFHEENEENSLIEVQDQGMSICEANETGNSLTQDDGIKKSIKRRRILIKEEVMSSEDEVPPNGKDPDKRDQKNLAEFESSEQRPDGSFDSEIPPSQYWLHEYKEMEKNNDEKKLMKMSPKKSSPIKKSDSDQKERMLAKAELIIKKESKSQRKSPPRITKTEIVSTKYKRIDQKIVKDGDEPFLERDGHKNVEKNENEGSSSNDNNESDDQMLSKKEKFQGIKFSEDELDIGEDTSEKEFSPKKISQNKRQSPKKNQASLKQKLKLKPKVVNNSSDIEVKSNMIKKNTSKRNLGNELNDIPIKTRQNIYDTDTSSDEEEKHFERKETPKNYVLGLEKPQNSIKKTSKLNGTQMVLVRKSSNLLKNEQSNLSHKSQSSPCKALTAHHHNVNDEYLSKDSSNNVAPSSTIEKKLSPKKKKHDNDRAEEAEASVKKAAISGKKQSIKHRESAGSLSTSLKRKLDSDNSSDDDEASPSRNVTKTLLRKELSEHNASSEMKSNKCAKLMPLSEGPVHAVSDSDETDSLTKLNTTLNKSMALMENKAEIIKLTKSRKSVSINTKHKSSETINTPNDAKAQKSILKKPEQIIQEQNVERNVLPVNAMPTIIRRPLTLENIKDQESLAYDSTEASFGLDDISDDDEIYILDVPRTVDPKELKGQTIRLGGKNKLEIGDQLYETCGKDATNISCVFRNNRKQTSYRTVNLRPAGCINVRQKLSKTLRVELSPLKKQTVPFPENLKIRHPLFGAEYKDKIAYAEKNVTKKTSRSVTRDESIEKTNEDTKVKQRQIKLKNVGKHKNKKDELLQTLNRGENNSIDKVRRTQEVHSDGSVSSDSDSDVSFFQTVKREKGKKSMNLLSLLNLDETPLSTDLPVQSESTIISVKRKESSANKKLGFSVNSSAIRNDSFLKNTKNSTFFSSTPIKVENDEKN